MKEMIMSKGRIVFNKVYEILSTIIIVLGVVIIVGYMYGIRLYDVRSGSMGDVLPVGCACFVNTHESFEDIKAGDIIAFRVSDDMFVTHRAARVTPEGIYTKGDENDTEDPDPVTEENYIGRTFYEIPRIGAALRSVHTRKGTAVISGIILLIVAAGFVYRKNNK